MNKVYSDNFLRTLKFCFTLFLWGCSVENGSNDPKSLVRELFHDDPSAKRKLEILTVLDEIGTGPYSFWEVYLASLGGNPSSCWTMDGYIPDKSPWPRKLQLLWAAQWAYVQISNGGIRQYLYNPGGETLPEVRLWLELVGDRKAADFFGELESTLGESLLSRRRRIEWLDTQTEDALYNLDERIGSPILHDDLEFDSAARKYLAEHCGVTSLLSRPPNH